MWIDRLKREFDDNPMQVIAVGALATTAFAKILDAVTSAQSRKAYSKQINHRVKSKK